MNGGIKILYLSKEEQKRLFQQYNNEEDINKKQAIKQQIIEKFIDLVPYYIKTYCSNLNFTTYTKEDIYQAGYEGLLHAIDRYDYQSEASFSTYLKYYVFQYVMKAFHMEDSIIHVPLSAKKEYLNFKKNKNSYSKEEQKILSEKYTSVRNALKPILYFDSPSRGAEEDINLLALLEDTESKKAFLSIENLETLYKIVEIIADTCSERDAELIYKYYGLYHERYNPSGIPYTQGQLAQESNLSASRIGQIIHNNVSKIRKELFKNGLWDRDIYEIEF